MSFETVETIPLECNELHFQKAVDVWLRRPNVCSKIISCARLEESKDDTFQGELMAIFKAELSDRPQEKAIYLRELIPKKPDRYMSSHEFVAVGNDCAIFIPLSDHKNLKMDEKEIPYSIRFTSGSTAKTAIEKDDIEKSGSHCLLQMRIYSTTATSADDVQNEKCGDGVNLKPCFPSEIWLRKKLLPQVAKWSEDEHRTSDAAATSKNSKMKLPPSLSLISQPNYATKYQGLKQKYGPEMIKVWDEVTDPQKYIYEDIAIATYLLLLWEKEREQTGSDQLQSFVDLGCGNGLLVHILNSEGHPGKGIDIRRRNIWSVYPNTTNLVEATIDPTDGTTYEGCDWLLGNHSDELTPWIPVMAARSGYNVRYWVLPCCFFDFFCKYKRSQSLNGQYSDYLNFVSEVGRNCGFNVDTDVMRIPSTKRVCQVGMAKLYPSEEHEHWLKLIEQYIDSRSLSSSTGMESESGKVCGVFEARDRTEKVRNCTKMDRRLQHETVLNIVKKLLEDENVIKVDLDGTTKEWNKGGSLPLDEATLLLNDDTKKQMKNECGGLQTLLRNHHQIFTIENGRVHIRDWSNLKCSTKKPRSHIVKNCRKTKQCWFHSYHPDGCPRTDAECTFKHGSSDS